MTEDWNELEETVKECRKCKLCDWRKQAVFGAGSQTAPVMFIGEAPGENEDLEGQPFVGRGGQFLDKLLKHVDLSRETNVYITNMVKCHPPRNRDPDSDEIDACIGYLRNQVKLLRPKLIVCLGRVAACALISPDYRVTKQHGEIINKHGTLMMGTFHPASMLRNPGQKPLGLDDFIKIRNTLDQLSANEVGK